MSRIVVAGTLDELSKTLEVTSKLGTIHMVDYDGDIEDISMGSPELVADEKSSLLVKMRGCAAEIEPTQESKKSLKEIRSLLDSSFPHLLEELLSKINSLGDTKNSLEKNSQSLNITSKLAKLNLDLELLGEYESLSSWIGDFGDLSKLKSKLENMPNTLYFSEEGSKKGIGAVFCEKEVTDKVQLIISDIDFDAITTPESSGPANNLLKELTKENTKLISSKESLEQEIETWNKANGANLLACMELLERDLEILNAPVRVAVSNHAFVMDGWIPTASVKESSVALKMVSTIVETENFVHNPHHGHDTHEELPPIAFTEKNISKPFELLTDLVGRPRYGRIDPTMFMLFTYPLFFGMMLGDVAYGIFTIILGLWIKNKFNDNESALLASKLVIYIGISCALFGILYGEILGFEVAPSYDHAVGSAVAGSHAAAESSAGAHAVPGWLAWMSSLYPKEHGFELLLPFNLTLAYPFHRVGHNMGDLIVISIYLGMLHLALGFLIGIRDVTKEHGLIAAFFEKGSWLVVLIGGFLVCYGYLTSQTEGITEDYASALDALMKYGGITLGIGVVCVSYGLAKYEGFGAIGIFVGPLETISLLSNTLSYIRLMAIGVVGVKIAEAGNMLGYENMVRSFELAQGGDILALFAGIGALLLWIGVQTFAWVLGVFSPNIHAARLHFVEWMKQFYDGSGEPFKPFGSKPKLVEIE